MKRRYGEELAELAKTYKAAVQVSLPQVDSLFAEARARPMLFVGSGGALAVARLAADLHQRATGLLAVATTPLEAVGSGPLRDVGLVLFSAGGKHPDAALAVAAARAAGYSFVGVVTCREPEDLPPEVASPGVHIASVPAPPDGFLATNSVLAMAAVVCKAYGVELPSTLPSFGSPTPSAPREWCIAVSGPGYAAVGLDLEARLSETGIAAVQLTDFRNLAHGRHVGLSRRLRQLSVISIVAPEYAALAAKTRALLPSETNVIEFRTDLPFPVGVLDLMVASMRLVGAAADIAGIDPGQPGVATFGRRLYHLSLRRLIHLPGETPVDRKLSAAGLGRDAYPQFEKALEAWLATASDERFHGILLDYDGTICSTQDRFRLPPESIRTELLRLADSGVVLGFASGRGQSLHRTTRDWVPRGLWSQIRLGLYNGTVPLALSEDLGRYDSCDGPLAAAADRLASLDVGIPLTIERRCSQVSVHSVGLTGAQLLPVVLAVLARESALDCKAFASGHSVDILPSYGSKANMLISMRDSLEGDVLAIGDQGQVGGNDFEFLAATRLSLSVDRCSADPTRCWNLDQRGARGPDLLVSYLKAIKLTGSSARFAWRNQ